MRIITLIILLPLIITPTAFSQNKIPVTRFTLDNGLQVWLHEDHTKPEVFGAVVVNGGAKLDEAHATGMAHYLEHMLFKGTNELGTTNYEKEKIHLQKIDSLYETLGNTTDKEKRKIIQLSINEQNKLAAAYAVPNEMDRLLAAIGGRGVNAFTNHDMVVYHNFFPPHQTEKWLELYSHRFVNPVFRLFQSELETVYEEKNRRMDAMGSKLMEDFEKSFYKQHPYGQRNVLGEVDHLKNPSLITMYNYFDTYYVPNNMALVISGDIDVEKIKPQIEEKFGVWKYKELPEKKIYTEGDFNGKEVMRGRYVPVKVGLIGYRTVAIGHEDEAVLEVINNLLSNANKTGLWDKLVLDNKLMMAGMEQDFQVDYGKTMLFFVPKIIGQSTKKAENLIIAQLNQVKQGEFSDEFLESVKLNLVKNLQLAYESNYRKALLMAQAFVTNQKWDELVNKEEKIALVDKALVVKKANEYFGNNRLVLYSKTGFPKKNKLEKPPYAPVIPQGKESEYAKNFKTIPEPEAKPGFVDIEKEITIKNPNALIQIYKVNNPANEVFSMQVHYGAGRLSDPRLLMLSSMLGHAGAGDLSRDNLKSSLSKVGATYSFNSTDLTFYLNLQGFDNKLEESMQLVGQLMDNPVFTDKGRKSILSSQRFDRRLEEKDINQKAAILREYQRYGTQSQYLNRLRLNEMKKISFDELANALKTVRQHELVVFYCGNKSIEEVEALVAKYFLSIKPTLPEKKDVRPLQATNNAELLFLHDKKAVQSQIDFFINTGLPRSTQQQANINAFNQYFGNNMSGLVFQEIREFRSLAYSATASLVNGSIYGTPAFLSGYIGCQADKTSEAMGVMLSLLKDLPGKPERVSDVQKALVQASAMARPSFRNLGPTVYYWKKQGYIDDPNISLLAQYKDISFQNIQATWETYLKEKSMSYAIAGNKNRSDLKKLSGYGKVKELKLSDIRTK
jgi:zinc protease